MPDDIPTLRSHLVTLLGNVSLTGNPVRCIWFGETCPANDSILALAAFSPAVASSILADVLIQRLYEDFYRKGRPSPQSPFDRMTLRAGTSQPFVDALSAANSGNGTCQTGWVVTGLANSDPDAATLTIRRNGLNLRASIEEIAFNEKTPARIGDEVGLRFPKELPAVSPGFYMALSDTPYSAANGQVVRLYWNLYPWAAANLLSGITSRLNGAGLRFQLKLIDHPDRYQRCDAAVLYLLKHDIEQAAPLLASVYQDVRVDLKQPVPAMTKWIAPGVGLAEDPPGGDSFGVHRCRLIANGLVRGWKQGANSVEDRLAAVIHTLHDAAIDLEHPYLNPGSVDDYKLSFGGDSRSVQVAATTPSTRHPTPQDYLNAAAMIGREICVQAYWHQGWCNWLGVETREVNAPAHHGITYASLGPELYGGSSGVALFLAELAAATGDAEARATALGAIRQALGRADTIKPPLQLGFYAGWPGLAYVAVKVGTLLDAEDVVLAARSLLGHITSSLEREHEYDLLGGAAGGIIALLRLAHLSDDGLLVERASSLGEQLITAAVCSGTGCSWPSQVSPGGAHLTGLAHGASGIGIALLELWHATGDHRFHTAAECAFAFERRWLNPATGNWPDFRAVDEPDARPASQLAYSTYWCHGAPGIALARLRAFELTGSGQYGDEAVVALSTCQGSIHQVLHDGTGNYSLCHGLAGNAAILLRGHQALGSEFQSFRSTALQVADEGMRLYAGPDREWPCGSHRGWTPGLMLGMAGIGHFYLGLSHPTLPSVLLP